MNHGSLTFLTNHAHVLLCLAHDPSARARDLAQKLELTERAVQKLIADLVDGGFIEKERVGRRNRYRLILSTPLAHPVERHRRAGELLMPLLHPKESTGGASNRGARDPE